MVTRANGAHHGTRPRFICDEEETLKRKKPGRLDPPGFFDELVRSREVTESSVSATLSVSAGKTSPLAEKRNFQRSPHPIRVPGAPALRTAGCIGRDADSPLIAEPPIVRPSTTENEALGMGWPAPVDSKTSVRRAGQRIRANAATDNDIAVLNRWRAAHGYIINTFQASLRNRTRGLRIPVAQRLKRAATIIDKLQQGRALDLASMQDIAGVRLVFPDVPALRTFRAGFHRTKAKHEMVNEPDRYDYIQSAKDSGYRGVHDIYRYRAGTAAGAQWNGLLIEVQYRTLVQHAWATAVELSDALTANRTKFSQGSVDNERFFRICSELLARYWEDEVSCLPDASRALSSPLRTLRTSRRRSGATATGSLTPRGTGRSAPSAEIRSACPANAGRGASVSRLGPA